MAPRAVTIDLEAAAAERERLRAAYLQKPARRPASTARGVHHLALLCSDVERTIRFYQELLGFPLVELFENRDYKGSTHLFFDLGHDNSLAFFDFPDLGLGPYAEVLGGFHHLAISVDRRSGMPPAPASRKRAFRRRSRARSPCTSPTLTACGSS